MVTPQPRCPVCRKPAPSDGPHAPFCRERCKMVDLGRWFRGEYVVAGEAAVAFDPELADAAGPEGEDSDPDA